VIGSSPPPHGVYTYLCVSYDSHYKQWLFALIRLLFDKHCGSCKVGTDFSSSSLQGLAIILFLLYMTFLFDSFSAVYFHLDVISCLTKHLFLGHPVFKTKLNSMAWVRMRTIPTDWATAACGRS
jgi:hypothetical protein